MHRSLTTRLATFAVGICAAVGAGVAVAPAAHAEYTDPDRGICQDGTNANPPGVWLRDPDGSNHPDGVYLTQSGFNGSQDHFYIESDYTRADGAHWYRGYGYDVDNGTKTYGEVLDTWIARSGGGC